MAVATRRRMPQNTLVPSANGKIRKAVHLTAGTISDDDKKTKKKANSRDELVQKSHDRSTDDTSLTSVGDGAPTTAPPSPTSTATQEVEDTQQLSSDMTATAGNTNNSSSDQILMKLCIEALKEAYPGGLATKEIFERISQRLKVINDDATNKSPVVCKSSSILSTKLNSFYRRYHLTAPGIKDIRTNMDTCPIERSYSEELPRRLVFKYMSPQERDEEASRRTRRAGSVTPPLEDDKRQSAETGGLQLEETEHEQQERKKSPQEQQPMRSVAVGQSPPPSPPYHLRRVIKRTPNAFVPPKRRVSEQQSSSSPRPSHNGGKTAAPKPAAAEAQQQPPPIKRQRREYVQSVPEGTNIYYDSESFSNLFLIDRNKMASNWHECEDVKSPEDMSLDDLDNMVN